MPDATSTRPIARHLRIHGRVQGVWFRASAKAEADRLGLAGWTRNLQDNSVEVLVAGPAQAITEFIAWAHQGPSKAHVERIDVSDAEPPADTGFHILLKTAPTTRP